THMSTLAMHLPSAEISGTRRSVTGFLLPGAGPTDFVPLSLHDALPISDDASSARNVVVLSKSPVTYTASATPAPTTDVRLSATRSEEHTSELQSRENLVCRPLLEKKKRRPTPKPRAPSPNPLTPSPGPT